jgi:hypothetical protein
LRKMNSTSKLPLYERFFHAIVELPEGFEATRMIH